MKGKRGQDAANAATLVAIIAGLIILYLLFLPPAERDALLKNNDDDNPIIEFGNRTNNTLLLEKPGRLSFILEDEFDHEIPSFTLFKTTSAQEIKRENPFSVRNGWFDKQKRNVTFSIKDLNTTENVMLTFNTLKRQGRLEIKLNGNVIFDASLATVNVVPITLDKRLLRSQNSLEFSVSGVGIAFWTTNEYTIEGLKITAEVTDLSRQQASSIFSLTDTEKFNLERAKLKFNPNCNENEVGALKVTLNSFEIFSTVPECKILNVVEIPINLLDAGKNRLVFKTTQGSYLVDQIVVETRLKQEPTTVYFFEVTDEQFESLINNSKQANLSINFVRRAENKRATISINGHLTSVNTDKRIFSKIIPKQHFLRGDNYIEIEPRTTLDILELRIDLMKRD